MSTDLLARWTVAGYLALALLIVAWRAFSSPQGWRLWVLYAIDSLYTRLCFRWKANRRCPFLDARPGILIANHRSPVDPMMIWTGVLNARPLEFMTAAEYFTVPGLDFIFHALHAIPVARDGKDMAATRTALRRLEEGRLVGVFPEGRINRGSGLLPGNPGIAWLALRSRAPVFPIFIENAPPGKGMVDPFWTFTRVRVFYGDAIDLSEFYERPRTAELLQEVTDLLMRRLGELGGLAITDAADASDDHNRAVIPMSATSLSPSIGQAG